MNKKNVKHEKINCWEHAKCGRERNGFRSGELGICPAWPDNGRFCWHIAGTLCGGKVQGEFAKKKGTCLACEFFTRVKNEEGADFELFDKDADGDRNTE